MPNFDADPYALYVWSAYGVSILVVGWLTIDSLLRSRRWKRAAEARKGLEKS